MPNNNINRRVVLKSSVPALSPIGLIAQDDWTVGASGWTKAQPSATIGLTGSSITFTGGGTGTTGNYAQWNGFISGSAKSEFEIEYTVSTIGAGLYLEFKSTSGTSNNNNSIRYYFNTSNLGAVLYNYNGAAVLTATSTTPTPGFTFNVGDTLRMKLTLNNFTATMETCVVGREQYVNTASYTTTYAPPFPYSVYMNNHYKVRIGTFGGTQTVNKWKFTLGDKKQITNLFIVDSLGRGLGASTLQKAYPYLINSANGKSVEVNGGPSNRMSFFITDLDEIKLYQAKNVFNCVGVNDLVAGTSIATITANCQSIQSAVQSVGSNFYQLAIIPNSLSDPNALNANLASTFGSNFIDIYTPLWSGSGFSMNSAYAVTSDTVPHMNDAGHDVVKNTLINYAI